MAKAYRSEEEFLAAKTRGEQVELEFMKQCTLLGGRAKKIGSLPGKDYAAPQVMRSDEDGDILYYTAPDVSVKFPNQPFAIAQIKAKKIMGELFSADAHFVLDADQLELMNEANAEFGSDDYGDVIFVVYCEQLKLVPGLSPFSYVSVDDLRPEKVRLHKRHMRGCDVFVLPLSLFRPLADLLRPRKDTAHATTPFVSPADEGRRKRDAGGRAQPARPTPAQRRPVSGDAPGIVPTEASAARAEPTGSDLNA